MSHIHVRTSGLYCNFRVLVAVFTVGERVADTFISWYAYFYEYITTLLVQRHATVLRINFHLLIDVSILKVTDVQ